MSIYVIGDLQGCYEPLRRLLDKIHYDPNNDQLWFAGDIVNRGPESLACLRFVANTNNCRIVLGNHDLHCLATAYGFGKPHPSDTLSDIVNAPDREELLQWLTHQPLFFYDSISGFCLVHAGILPAWNLSQAIQYAEEAEFALRTNTEFYLKHLYGHQPDTWDETLIGVARWRFIVNVFTRMRYCLSTTQLELHTKSPPDTAPASLIPWFAIHERRLATQKILFGHWASLNCQVSYPNLYPLDSGCIWGGSLTALRLEDGKRFQVPGLQKSH